MIMMMMVIIIISDVCRKLLRKLEFLRVFATPYLVAIEKVTLTTTTVAEIVFNGDKDICNE